MVVPHPRQVDAEAYAALLECVGEGTFHKCESVPAGDDAGYLVQPIGGIAVENAGPARYGFRFTSRSSLTHDSVQQTVGGVLIGICARITTRRDGLDMRDGEYCRPKNFSVYQITIYCS